MKDKKYQKQQMKYFLYFATNIFNVMLKAYKMSCYQNHKMYRSNVFDLLSTMFISSLIFSLAMQPIFTIYSTGRHFFI
jgi:hypothetical protein